MGCLAQGIANRAHRCTETENQRIQDPHSQPHCRVLHLLLARSSRISPYHCYNLSASDRTSGFAWLASASATFATLRMGPLSRFCLPNQTALSVRSLLSSPKKTDWLLHGSSGLRRSLSSARPRREHLQQRTCRQALYQACPPPSFAQEKQARGRS